MEEIFCVIKKQLFAKKLKHFLAKSWIFDILHQHSKSAIFANFPYLIEPIYYHE